MTTSIPTPNFRKNLPPHAQHPCWPRPAGRDFPKRRSGSTPCSLVGRKARRGPHEYDNCSASLISGLQPRTEDGSGVRCHQGPATAKAPALPALTSAANLALENGREPPARSTCVHWPGAATRSRPKFDVLLRSVSARKPVLRSRAVGSTIGEDTVRLGLPGHGPGGWRLEPPWWRRRGNRRGRQGFSCPALGRRGMRRDWGLTRFPLFSSRSRRSSRPACFNGEPRGKGDSKLRPADRRCVSAARRFRARVPGPRPALPCQERPWPRIRCGRTGRRASFSFSRPPSCEPGRLRLSFGVRLKRFLPSGLRWWCCRRTGFSSRNRERDSPPGKKSAYSFRDPLSKVIVTGPRLAGTGKNRDPQVDGSAGSGPEIPQSSQRVRIPVFHCPPPRSRAIVPSTNFRHLRAAGAPAECGK